MSLPKTTFKASGGVNNPSLLLVRKFTNLEAVQADAGIVDAAYPVFMAVPGTAGIDNRANPVYLRHPDGREQVDSEGKRIKDDEISTVAQAFQRWVKSRA